MIFIYLALMFLGVATVCMVVGGFLGWLPQLFLRDGGKPKPLTWWSVLLVSFLAALFSLPCFVGAGHGGFPAPLLVGFVLLLAGEAELGTGTFTWVGGGAVWLVLLGILTGIGFMRRVAKENRE